MCLFLIYCCCVIERTSNPAKKENLSIKPTLTCCVFVEREPVNTPVFPTEHSDTLLVESKETYTEIEEVNGV